MSRKKQTDLGAGASPAPDRAAYESLIDQRRRFVDEYMIDLNGTRAAIRASYAERSADTTASKLLGNCKVQAALRHKMRERERRTEVTADRVVQELARIAFANLRELHRIDADGQPVPSFEGASDDAWAALSEVTTDVYMEGSGDAAQAVKRTRIKLADKLGALNSLARHLGLFLDRQEVSGPGGQPLQVMLEAQRGAVEKLEKVVRRRSLPG